MAKRIIVILEKGTIKVVDGEKLKDSGVTCGEYNGTSEKEMLEVVKKLYRKHKQ